MPEIVFKWIKITTGMFDDEKIRLIESMPDCDTLLVIWIKLIVQAGRTNASGYIFLNENIPYTDEMLATIFSRPLNTVRLALKTFQEFGMIQMDERGILINNFSRHQSVEGMERVRQLNRERQERHRNTLKAIGEGKKESNVTNVNVTAQSKSKSKSKKESKKESKTKALKRIHQQILDTYNQEFNTTRQVLNDTLTKRITETLKAHTMDEILASIKKAATLPFYTGDNERGWVANLEYFFRVQEDNIEKILVCKDRPTGGNNGARVYSEQDQRGIDILKSILNKQQV